MPIELSNDTLTIQTPFLRRVIGLSPEPETREIYIHPPCAAAPRPLHHLGGGLPLEAAVKVGGAWHFCGPGGSFRTTGCTCGRGSWGERAAVTVVAAELGLELEIVYEASETVPLLCKSVVARNRSQRRVVIDNLAVEAMYPGLAGRMIHFLDDFRLETRGSDRLKFGLLDFQFPADIEQGLEPGEELESFRLYEYFTAESEGEYTIQTNRVLRLLAPWGLKAAETCFQVSGVTADPEKPGIEAFFPLLEACREAGLEKVMFFFGQLFTNTGDYRLRPEFFPGGEADLVRLVRYIHQRGMKAGVYSSYSIAWRESEVCREHDEWQCRGAGGETFDPSAYGNMCFLSPWGDYIKGQFDRLIAAGFDEFQLDGPTDIPCFRTDHRHGAWGNYQYRNWLWERELFAGFRERGAAFTIPRFDMSFLLLGASAVPGGYLEEDFCHTEGMDLLKNYRASICAGRRRIPGWCSWGFLAIGTYHGHRILADEQHPEIFEHGLASLFGYGQMRSISGPAPAFGPVTAAILKRWVELVKANRQILQGDFIPLRPPDGVSAEAILWACRESRQGLLILLNPGADERRIRLLLPLERLGLKPGEVATGGFREERMEWACDGEGFALFSDALKPLEVKTWQVGLKP